MRKRGASDSNQPELVKRLRLFGVSVEVLSAVGCGCPDLLLGWQGRNVLVEVKDPTKPPNKRRLTPDQEQWHREWKGQVGVAHDLTEALELLGLKVAA